MPKIPAAEIRYINPPAPSVNITPPVVNINKPRRNATQKGGPKNITRIKNVTINKAPQNSIPPAVTVVQPPA